jgi:hypothetical protein
MRLRLLIAIALLSACASGGFHTPSAAVRAEKRLTFSILEDYDKGDDLSDVAKDFALFRELGVTTWRGSFGWDDYEPSRGVYDFDWLHRFADLAAQFGITLRPYIGYTPAWASDGGSDAEAWNDPPARLDDWSNFVTRLAGEMRRHRNIASYEIYNEENVTQWWDGDVVRYRNTLQRAARGIKRAAPTVQVLVGGMTFPDTAWIEHVCADGTGGLIDVVPFHAYPETWTPPDVDVERYLGPGFRSGFVGSVDRACGRKPIWMNEIGFATTDRRSEDAQAGWWARAITTFAAERRVEHIGIYEIKDLALARDAIGGAPNYHLGITHADRTRKPAFATIQMLVALLGTAPFLVEDDAVRLGDGGSTAGVLVHAFELRGGRHLLALWTKANSRTVDVSLPKPARRIVERQLDGRSSYASIDSATLRNVALTAGAVRIFELEP